MNRYAAARSLQLLGLLVLPFAIVSELMEQVTLGQSMLLAVGGLAIFYLGRSIQPPGPV
jgi:hypothetical protein